MKQDDLFLTSYVFSSDDDGNPVEDIYIGFDKKKRLIALLIHRDYDLPEYDCCAYAVIEKEEAFQLARRLKVSMTDLPDVVASSVDDDYYEVINPSLKVVKECFRDILENFSYEGCRFRLVRTYGKYGYTCY